jgi:hypothetical protein
MRTYATLRPSGETAGADSGARAVRESRRTARPVAVMDRGSGIAETVPPDRPGWLMKTMRPLRPGKPAPDGLGASSAAPASAAAR